MKFLLLSLGLLSLFAFTAAKECNCKSGTCCLSESNKQLCCPFENGVCCSDRAHCCPEGHICMIEFGYCQRDFGYMKANSNNCGCDEGSTCCDVGRGQEACCPYEDAVCCNDHEHCCPKGYSCDLQNGECIRSSFNSNDKNFIRMAKL